MILFFGAGLGILVLYIASRSSPCQWWEIVFMMLMILLMLMLPRPATARPRPYLKGSHHNMVWRAPAQNIKYT